MLPDLGVEVTRDRVRLSGGHSFPIPAAFVDPEAKLAAEQAMGFEAAVLSIPASVFLYGADAAAAEVYCQTANAAMGRVSRGPFRAMGILPLQHAGRAVAELRRAVREDGLAAFAIGASVGGRPLWEGELGEVLAEAARLAVLLFLHPAYEGPRPGLERFYAVNVIGNPLETSTAVYELLASGTLARLRGVRLLLAHGGGFLPYLSGRIARAAAVRAEVTAGSDPIALLRGLDYDTVVYRPETLRFLVAAAGPERVLCGSDHPFDMGDPDPVGSVRAAGLDPVQEAAVLGGNAAARFGF